MNTILLEAAQQGGGGNYSMIIMMVVLFAVMYFFMIRPQNNKKQKEIQKFRDALTVGQDVVTIGGIHGTIKNINAEEGTVTLEVATGVKIVFAKEAINPVATAGKK